MLIRRIVCSVSYEFLILFSSRPRSEQSLVRWATPQLHDIDALAKMVDPALNGVYPAKSLSRFADIIALCVQVACLLDMYVHSFYTSTVFLAVLVGLLEITFLLVLGRHCTPRLPLTVLWWEPH